MYSFLYIVVIAYGKIQKWSEKGPLKEVDKTGVLKGLEKVKVGVTGGAVSRVCQVGEFREFNNGGRSCLRIIINYN